MGRPRSTSGIRGAAILDGEPLPIQGVRPDLPDDVARVVMRMLSGDLEDRYATAQELLADLETLRSGTAV